MDSAPFSQEEPLPFTQPQFVERRVWVNIFAVIIIGVAVSALAADSRFTLGLALGGGLAILNYRWLQSSLRDVLGAGLAKTPPGTILKFVVRWLVVAAIGWAANETGYFEGAGILAGLFTPAIAIMIEAGYVTARTIAARNGER
ncbi:MAG: ATP synthase subunit I [Acidobacteriota bacterium]